jgi:hypothetical protein
VVATGGSGMNNIEIKLFHDEHYLSDYGKIVNCKIEIDEIEFGFANGFKLSIGHEQSCCETVELELDCFQQLKDMDLIGTKLYFIEVVDNAKFVENYEIGNVYNDNSHTWTFYNLKFLKGYGGIIDVQLRWLGTSNGYYSERVDIKLIIP